MNEPAVIEAVRRLGNHEMAHEPAKDLILNDISTRVALHPWIDNGALHEAIAWGFLRQCCKGPVSLSKFLEPILAPELNLPAAIGKQKVHATVSKMVSPIEIETSNGSIVDVDDWERLDDRSTIWRGFRRDAGMDLMLRTLDGTILGICAKPDAVKPVDAVMSCTLSWQYMRKRTPVNEGLPPTSKQHWFKDHLPHGAANPHLRLVFSISGFSKELVDEVNDHNSRNPDWAIILCELSPSLFGPVDAIARKQSPEKMDNCSGEDIHHIGPGFACKID